MKTCPLRRSAVHKTPPRIALKCDDGNACSSLYAHCQRLDFCTCYPVFMAWLGSRIALIGPLYAKVCLLYDCNMPIYHYGSSIIGENILVDAEDENGKMLPVSFLHMFK